MCAPFAATAGEFHNERLYIETSSANLLPPAPDIEHKTDHFCRAPRDFSRPAPTFANRAADIRLAARQNALLTLHKHAATHH